MSNNKTNEDRRPFTRIPAGKPKNDHYRILYTPPEELSFNDKFYLNAFPGMKDEYEEIHGRVPIGKRKGD